MMDVDSTATSWGRGREPLGDGCVRRLIGVKGGVEVTHSDKVHSVDEGLCIKLLEEGQLRGILLGALLDELGGLDMSGLEESGLARVVASGVLGHNDITRGQWSPSWQGLGVLRFP